MIGCLPLPRWVYPIDLILTLCFTINHPPTRNARSLTSISQWLIINLWSINDNAYWCTIEQSLTILNSLTRIFYQSVNHTSIFLAIVSTMMIVHRSINHRSHHQPSLSITWPAVLANQQYQPLLTTLIKPIIIHMRNHSYWPQLSIPNSTSITNHH